MERVNQFESREKPPHLYHGTVSGGIEEFEPRKRFTPGGADVPPRVYAADNPALAAAHAFPWHSGEGVDLSIEDGKVILSVPEALRERLSQSVYVYTLDSSRFNLTTEDATERTYHTEVKVRPLEVLSFASVREAVEHFGGEVVLV